MKNYLAIDIGAAMAKAELAPIGIDTWGVMHGSLCDAIRHTDGINVRIQ